MKKLMLIMVSILLCSTVVFASGATEGEEDKDVTLSVMWFNDANESDVFLDTIDEYLKANENVKVDMQVVSFSEYEQKLKLMISGGNPPDIARVTNNHLSSLGSSLEPINNYVDDISAVEDMFMPGSIAFAKDGDNLLAYPTEATANGMLVNLTAWENAGIDVKELSKTWTWEQWEDAVKEVIKANDGMKYGLALDFSPHRYSTILFEFGGRQMNLDQSEVEFTNEGTINSINWFKRLHDEGLIPSSVWLGSENPAELFQAGLVACHIGGSWNINTYNTNVKDFEWCAVNTPKEEIRSSVPGGKFIASFKDSENKEEAMKLMAAFSSKESNEKYCADTFNLSARVDTDVPYISNKEDFTVFSEDLKVTPAFTALEWKASSLNKVYSYIREQIVQVLMGNISAEEATMNIDKEAAKF
ncbi:MAG: sugar ABC transporter substrate-binding protein [Sphaerochaetaceae bacterium]|nr:sugar ABC transporter substrate-binding protein [Sphaerochaetaceae bacterium]MDC7250384.1 sugar ABC transporter substrate-binding protein [Sphaerochaetaceae bacterium]